MQQSFIPPWESGEVLQGIPTGTSHAKGRSDLAHRTEENLRPHMKVRRDAFVAHYLETFDKSKAGTLAGIPAASLSQQVNDLWHEPYVQQQILAGIKKIEETDLITRNVVICGLLKEANNSCTGSSHAARVGAWDKLAKILGMEITKTEITTPTGVNLSVSIAK